MLFKRFFFLNNCLVLIAYAQTLPFNAHTGTICSRVRDLNFDLSLHLYLNFVYVSSKCILAQACLSVCC